MSVKGDLLGLAASLVKRTNMPSQFREDWNLPKSVSDKTWRKIWLAAALADQTCLSWARELRDIIDRMED